MIYKAVIRYGLLVYFLSTSKNIDTKRGHLNHVSVQEYQLNVIKRKFIGSSSTTKTCRITLHKKWKIIINLKMTYSSQGTKIT